VSDQPELVEVRLIALPLEEQQLASEHFDELMREFALIRDDVDSPVPGHLLELREALVRDFDAFAAAARVEIDAAAARGDDSVDVRYLVPAAAGPAAAALGDLLGEADAFCRAGEHLLTLATPGRAVRYRRWFLGEFSRQIAGEPPLPWSASP
jgi:hypothetical protein